MIVKVCGMRDAEDIAAIARCGPDMMGFIFYAHSPRNACAMPPEALAALPPEVRRVGVFVDAPREEVLRTVRRYALDFVQLHGAESPSVCAELRAVGVGVIKALGVACAADVERAAAYDGTCDLYIFDTAAPTHGGTGRRFDHGLLAAYTGRTPFLVSGGIGPEDAETLAAAFSTAAAPTPAIAKDPTPALAAPLAERIHPLCAGVDINSRFETAPGVKDPAAVEKFILTIKKSRQ